MKFNLKDRPLNLWVKNGVAALAIAGLYSVVVVALRVPMLSRFFSDKAFFKTALVVHVNLSVLVWLLSGAAIIFSMNKIKTGLEVALAKLAFWGMVFMATSPLFGERTAIMNNYIPMLENIIFIIGLCFFGVSILLLALQSLFTSFVSLYFDSENQLLGIASFTLSLQILLVWICFYLSFWGLVNIAEGTELEIDFYYEMLYWSGGHLLQFVYTQILMFLWIMLISSQIEKGVLKFNNIYYGLFILNFVLSLGVFYGHFHYAIEDSNFKEYYTEHMKYAGGLAPSLFCVFVVLELLNSKAKLAFNKFTIAAFVASVLLFFLGGIVGIIISGVNVTIPAHYHGMIVGISVALMGVFYIYCYLGEREIIYIKSPAIQIYIFTFGQILHIMGLALAGGYGVLRKNPGEDIAPLAKIYMGMVGGGGLIAVISGLMFVYICVKRLMLEKC